MTIQDLTDNKERIIKNIKWQITSCTPQNIKDVMNKMVAMLPQFENEKGTKGNIDKLTNKATLSYIKHGITFTATQNNNIDRNIEIKRSESIQSSLQK